MCWGNDRIDDTVPCYECQERFPGCHAKCERYEVFAKERELKREANTAATQLRVDCWATYRRWMIRREKKRRK